MESLVQSAASWALQGASALFQYLGDDYSSQSKVFPAASDDDELLSMTDYYEEDPADPRLFIFFNTSTTLTTAQAIAIILGLTALIGGLSAAGYFFLISMQGGGGTGSGYGHSSGYSSNRYKRSNKDEEAVEEMATIVRLISDLEEQLKQLDIISNPRDSCEMRMALCRIMASGNHGAQGTEKDMQWIQKLDEFFEKARPIMERDLHSAEFYRLEGYLQAGDFGAQTGTCEAREVCS